MSNIGGIKGHVKIERYEAEFIDGEWVPIELVDTIEHPNRICVILVDRLFQGDTQGRNDMVTHVHEGIFVGAVVAKTDDAGWATATVANADTYTAPAGAADAFHEFSSTVNPPASGTRQIRTIALTSNSTTYDDSCYTLVTLPTPCPQTSTEILQVTYRLINDQSAVAALGSISNDASEKLFERITYTFGSDAYQPTGIYALPYDNEAWGKGLNRGVMSQAIGISSTSNNTEIYYDDIQRAWTNTFVCEGLVRGRLRLRLGINGVTTSSSYSCGMPIKAIAQGNSGYWCNIADVTKGSLSSVQNIYGRTADTGSADRVPYFDNNIIATSAADVVMIDKGDWENSVSDGWFMPYIYRVKIVLGGDTGTATYQLQRRRSPCKWVDNSERWIPHGIPFNQFHLVGNATSLPYGYLDVSTADSARHGQTVTHSRAFADSLNDGYVNRNDLGDTRTLGHRYVYPEAYSWDYDGLTFFSLQKFDWTNLDANSAQAQTFTEILQVGSDGLDVYVADASQGLYKIERDFRDFDTTNWTITKLNPPGITNTNSCRGVYLKGGSYHGHPGKIVDVNIISGGSNYTVGDTITFAGVNGTSATANVARVDADGVITAIAITNQGSGYLEDHLQAYVSSGNGVGATLEPVVGAGGDLWAIFNDTTDSAVYMAHMTHVGSNDYTSLNLDTTGDTITRTGGTDFLVDGFRPGQALIIRSAEEAANEGRYTISTVTSTVITVTENITTTNATDTQAQIFAENWEIMTETISDDSTSYNFNGAGNPDTITGNGTSFLTQGFREGMKIVIANSENTGENDGIYTIADVTATVITLDDQDSLVTNTADTTATIDLLTDFTITNYTSGTPGGTGFIGLVMDPDHADDRFALLTPDTKQANDGGTLQSDAGFDWWSFANSTGTTAAGTTDRVRVAAHNNDNRSLSLEQLATQCIGPLDATAASDLWLIAGLSQNETASYPWGSATRTARDDNAILHRYIPHRCQTGFDIGVVARGSVGQFLKSNRIAADFGDANKDSTLCYYGESQYDQNINDYNFGQWGGSEGGIMGTFGRGVFWHRMFNNSPGQGGYVFGANGDGTIAGENALPYGIGWQDFGWDGTRWVLDNAGARTCHAQSSFSGTSLNINATTGAIVGTGFASTDWAGDNFEAGDIITIANAEDAANNGDYRIESLSGTTLTVTPDKLPGVTNTDDTTATVIGDRAIIDNLALSFDTSGAAPLVTDEYYDCWMYDGIINDNATDGTIQAYSPYMPTLQGTDFEAATIPNSDVGAVVNEPITMRKHSTNYIDGSGPGHWNEEPGVWANANYTGSQDEIMFSEQQIPASSDFTLRWKIAGSYNGRRMDVGVCPYNISNTGGQFTDTNMDYNARVAYDYTNNPTQDVYTIEIRNTGSGTVQHTENTDRVVLVEAQDETNYNGVGSNGTFIGGYESATDTHAATDILTMNDGTIVTVDAVDGNGTVTQFTITTNSTKTSGNGQIDAVSSSATSIDFNTTGNTITRTAGGTDFITDGFRIGMKIQVDGATTEANDGAYTIATVSTTVITTEENLNTTETGTSATIQHAIVQTASDGTGVNFALIPGTNNTEAADTGGDEFALNRRGTTGNNLYWTLNGVEFYTHTGGPFNDQYNPAATQNASTMTTVYDFNLDHTIDRRYLKVGNGTTTGAFDNNFRCLPTILAGTEHFRLYYNDGSGPVEFTYVTDGYTAPASGEVSILPFSGVLWFNTAQAGDTLTGNWTTTLKINTS